MRRISAAIYAGYARLSPLVVAIVTLHMAVLIPTARVSTAEPPAVRVEVSPKVQQSGRRNQGEVYVKLTVPRDARNRAVCVVIDGPTFRSSCRQLDGLRASYREEWPVKALDAGSYSVFANLERADRSVITTRDQFCIAGDGVSCGLGMDVPGGLAEEP